MGSLLFLLVPTVIAGAGLAVVIEGKAPGFFALDRETLPARLDAIQEVLIAEVGERPSLSSEPIGGQMPLCDTVPHAYDGAFRAAFRLMRGTREGARLYSVLSDEGVCVDVGDLPYNTAYAASRGVGGDWSSSFIVVDRRYIRSVYADVLAAILVHEATHIDRAVSGEACYFERSPDGEDGCERLANGVTLDEELVAHEAEAEWWIAAYGSDGKRFAWSNDYAENQLVKAYRQGEGFFRTYVTRIRSDAREGEGF